MATPYSNEALPRLYKMLTDTLGTGDIAHAVEIAETIGNVSGIEPDAVVQRAMRNVEDLRLPSLHEQSQLFQQAADASAARAASMPQSSPSAVTDPFGLGDIEAMRDAAIARNNAIYDASAARTASPVIQNTPTEALISDLGNMPQADASGQFGFDIESVLSPGRAGTPTSNINVEDSFDRSIEQALSQAPTSQASFERPVSTQFGEQMRMKGLTQAPIVSANSSTEQLMSELRNNPAPLSHAYASAGAQTPLPTVPSEAAQSAFTAPKRPSKAVRNWRPAGSTASAPSTDGLMDELSGAAGTAPKRPITFGKTPAPAPDVSNSGLKGLHSTLTGGGANSIGSGTLGGTANVANDMGKASASRGGLGGLFGNLGKKNTLAKPAGGQGLNVGYTKGKGLSAFGKNLGSYAALANTGINAFGALQGLADSADEGRRTEDLSADVLTAAASNPMSTYGLTTDQLKTLGDVRSGRFDASADVSDLDFGGALSGALSGGLVGLAGGIPGAIAGALSGGAKGAVGGLSQAKARKNAELEALYQALNQSNTDYQNAMRSRALERYF